MTTRASQLPGESGHAIRNAMWQHSWVRDDHKLRRRPPWLRKTGIHMNRRSTTALVLALLLTGCTGMPENNIDPALVSELASCPSSPNCVCSCDAGDSHYIAPIKIDGDVDRAWRTLQDILDADRSFEIIASGDHYIKAESTTRILRFTDDVEFLLDRSAGQIEMRSASRIGYSDLGKNRKRMEGIRDRMIDAGVASESQASGEANTNL